MTRLIDADALDIYREHFDTYADYSHAFDMIDNAPTIDPVRHAKLLNAHPYGECSNCGYLIDIREEFNYCPNCGARMDAE